MKLTIKQEQNFRYVEEGEGEVLLLLHGLFGALSNFADLVEAFKPKYKVVLPMLPIFELPLLNATLKGLTRFVEDFVAFKGYKDISVLGNSLGGHIALFYAFDNSENVRSIILTGSSGLYEKSLGDTFPKRGNYEFIKERTEYTFYEPSTASKELVDEVYDIVNSRNKAIRIISVAKSAMRNNLADQLPNLHVPALLIWGKDDRITPPFVGEQFRSLLPNAELHLLDKCGHAPMMERPAEFNAILDQFLSRVYQKV
jgi:2-hydroxy-6-oxonona-2,4-dienedioate hydrolase